MSIRFGVGQPVRRIEDRRLVTGQGCYTDDVMPGEGLHVAFLRAPFAHARLTHLELDAARQAPGVLLVASQDDLDADGIRDITCRQWVEFPDGSPIKQTTKPAMVRGINRHAGDIVAMVVAETREQARDALDLIEMDFDPMDAVTDIYAAMADGAPQLHEEYPNNVAFEWHAGRMTEARAAIDDARKTGRKIVEIDVVNSRVMINSMETRPMIARPHPERDGALQVYCGSQGAIDLAELIAECLNLETEDLHLIAGDVGGSFGFKIFLHPEQVCISWAAQKLGKMVRWQQDRSEAFLSDLQGRDHRTKARAVVTDEGRIEALEINCHANMGSWLSNFGIYIPTLSACRTMTGCYDIQAAGMSVKGVMTNTPAVDAYRGAGRPEANYVIERLMDHIAAELGLDRIVVRKTNLIKPEQIPYTLAAVGTIDSGDMPGLLEHALEKADWAGFAKRKEEAATRGKKLGIGAAMYLECAGGGTETDIEFTFEADGTLVVYASQHDNGQGHRTTMTQILSHTLGYDADKIKILQGDSWRNPAGITGGAKMTPVLGSTMLDAGGVIIEKAREDAAESLEASTEDTAFDEGVFTAAGTNRSITLEEVVRMKSAEDSPHPYDFKHTYAASGSTFPHGCHIAEIEVDAVTMRAKLTRFTVVDDFGTVINPLTLEGQIHGGVAQGVGQALYEFMAYDEDGQLLSGSLMDYTLPRADDLPRIDIYTRNTPCLNNALGAKGAGEAGAIGSTPAVISALSDALGVTHIDMPATPQHIWERMKQQA